MKRILALSLFLFRAAFLHAESPNIVLIVADDLGYGDLACYGSTVHETPHLDGLAATGMRFTDFHSGGAMCSPTRASILTGCYPQRFGSQFDGALSAGNPDSGLPLGVVTVAEMLRGRGYATACFGKWHLGYRAPLLPTNQGFDIFRGLLSGDGDFHTRINRSGGEDWWWNDKLEPASGYTTDLLTDYSVEFMEENRDSPFFLYLPHLAIHFPWQGPEDPPHREKGISYKKDKFGIISDPSNVAPHVKAMVESLDAGVGRVLAALKEQGLVEKTLVIFTSDNGGYLNYGSRYKNISSNGRYRGQKTELYEGGHRVPTIVSWPGRIEPGVTNAMTHSNDLFPTLMEIANAGKGNSNVDGLDLSPLLFDERSLPERSLFWRSRSQRAIRGGPWKLCLTGNRVELFHLGRDPSEKQNLAREHPERVQDLTAVLNAWELEMDATASRFGLETK
ncbi:MAG: sulfatase [Verrucomicrobiales bacterium]|nr:sulfatase [Verrucomicrobiales bacterium]